jgi:NADH-quinone oxidoreductase subunit C
MSELLERLKEKVTSQFGEALIEGHMDYDFPVLVVAKPQIKDILTYLKAEGFTYLTTMCGIHFPDNVGAEFAVMYQLHSLERNERVRIKTFMSEKDIEMPTITDLWAAANWMEREAFDFYGFKFKGHPNLKRILNMDEMNYHPLRKEYPLEDASRHDKEDKYFGR